MQISGIENAGAPLRLVPVQTNQAAGPTAPKSPLRIADGDTVSFETAYISGLPRVSLTEAHRRLEMIRHRLVAARTQVPVYFADPRIVRTGDPFAAPEQRALKFAPNPADHNAAATERHLG